MLLDSCFLVDEQRGLPECKAFFGANGDERFCISEIIAGELAVGYDPTGFPDMWSKLARFDILPLGRAGAEEYARAYRHLRSTGQMIGSNDLWIAKTALAYNLPLVTRNVAEFTRVPRLRVVGY